MQRLWPEYWILGGFWDVAFTEIWHSCVVSPSSGQVWALVLYSNHRLTHKKQLLTKTGSNIK